MDYRERVGKLLVGAAGSVGVRGLNPEEAVVLKVAIIKRDERMMDTLEGLLAEEKAGREMDLAFLKGVIEEFSGKHDEGEIREAKEALANRQEVAYLEQLMGRFDK